jgi:hypothetical protein
MDLFKIASIYAEAAAKMSVKSFVQNHGPYDKKKNLKIFNDCKKNSKTESKCEKWMAQFEKARDRYLEDRKGGKDYNDSMLHKVMKACEKFIEKKSKKGGKK